MKGENELTVSQETLLEMVQFYIDHRMPALGAATLIKTGKVGTQTFEITLQAREEPPPVYGKGPLEVLFDANLGEKMNTDDGPPSGRQLSVSRRELK